MKHLRRTCLSWLLVISFPAFAQTSLITTNAPSFEEKVMASKKELLSKFDLNHNGNLDVQERKGYLKELANLMQQFAKQEAQKMGTNTVAKELNDRRPRDNRLKELQSFVEKYDLNKDGRLNAEELQHARSEQSKIQTDGKQMQIQKPTIIR